MIGWEWGRSVDNMKYNARSALLETDLRPELEALLSSCVLTIELFPSLQLCSVARKGLALRLDLISRYGRQNVYVSRYLPHSTPD